MKPLRILTVILAVIGLAACYTSEKPLITEDQGAVPFQKITFINEDGKPLLFTAEGKTYKQHSDDGDTFLILKPVEGDFYVAQLTGGSGDSLQILYGYMRLDGTKKVADIYKMIGTKTDVRPGLRECKDGICIDDLAAYVAYAQEGIKAGGAPETSMKIEVE